MLGAHIETYNISEYFYVAFPFVWSWLLYKEYNIYDYNI